MTKSPEKSFMRQGPLRRSVLAFLLKNARREIQSGVKQIKSS